jgi:hypothetical protein
VATFARRATGSLAGSRPAPSDTFDTQTDQLADELVAALKG